jgi:glycosyltransferase involved in cell wall biosynthesis
MKISIVMPSYNQVEYVERSIQSILRQNYKNKELIFMDGGSTDLTMQIVERYRSDISVIVSEPDKGQSDALNKGFKQATGDIFTWLSTDDILLPDALQNVSDHFNRNKHCQFLLGNVIWIDRFDNLIKCWKGQRRVSIAQLLEGSLPSGGPSAFFTRAIFEAVGGVNVSLHYAMDTELWWKFINMGADLQRLPDYVWALRLHPDAKVSGQAFADRDRETHKLITAQQNAEMALITALIDQYRVHPGKTQRAATRGRVVFEKLNWAAIESRLHSLKWRGKKLQEFEGIVWQNKI